MRKQLLIYVYAGFGFMLGIVGTYTYVSLSRTSQERCTQAIMRKMDKDNTNIDREVEIMYLADAACADADNNANRAMQLIEGLKYNH